MKKMLFALLLLINPAQAQDELTVYTNSSSLTNIYLLNYVSVTDSATFETVDEDVDYVSSYPFVSEAEIDDVGDIYRCTSDGLALGNSFITLGKIATLKASGDMDLYINVDSSVIGYSSGSMRSNINHSVATYNDYSYEYIDWTITIKLKMQIIGNAALSNGYTLTGYAKPLGEDSWSVTAVYSATNDWWKITQFIDGEPQSPTYVYGQSLDISPSKTIQSINTATCFAQSTINDFEDWASVRGHNSVIDGSEFSAYLPSAQVNVTAKEAN
jgi:hypothetical protein